MIDIPPDEFRRLGYRAVDLLADYFESLSRKPCRSQPLPHAPSDPDALLDYVGSTIFRFPMGNGSPRFFGWINPPSAPGDVFLTGTELAGRFVLRACIVNFRTTEQDLEALIEAVRMAGERVREQGTALGPA